MQDNSSVTNSSNGLSVTAYRGERSAMLAFDLDRELTQDLAGFAIHVTDPSGENGFLKNRLSFTKPITSRTRPEGRVWTPSNHAPFQTFRWVHHPTNVHEGIYRYKVTARYFTDPSDPTRLTDGPSVEVALDLTSDPYPRFKIGFTRGHISSRAYQKMFSDPACRHEPVSLGYDRNEYDAFEPKYRWLGCRARTILFDFLDECIADRDAGIDVSVDLFAYDLDEPLFLHQLARLGNRVRAFLDDAAPHSREGAIERRAKAVIEHSAGPHNVRTSHFSRFAHTKALIKKIDGRPVKVLTGSADFSVRGLYVQANEIMVFDDPTVAGLYEDVFELCFACPNGFSRNEMARRWFDFSADGLPRFSFCFSPHTDPDTSLARVRGAIDQATSSVLYATTDTGGAGEVMDMLRRLPHRPGLFTYGITQTRVGADLFRPGETHGLHVPYAYLKSRLPRPFRDELSGGPGQIVHDKFITLDFNGANPVVFTGSSSFTAATEKANGDTLIAIHDKHVATAYAAHAVRLIDHIHFRALMSRATQTRPLMLKTGDWWRPYYDPGDPKFRERELFARCHDGVSPSPTPHPAGSDLVEIRHSKQGARLTSVTR